MTENDEERIVKLWEIPFTCYYGAYVLANPEDHCAVLEGKLTVDADDLDQAIGFAEKRLGKFGFDRVLIFEDLCIVKRDYDA